jgi:prepilin-type N-terminal cleavage/methylation domain-containing protein
MRVQHTQPAAVRTTAFSLVELLTVMAIVGVLLAVAVPVVLKVSSGSSVEAAARMVGAQLRLARQEAIVRRRPVAVLFPRTNLDAAWATANNAEAAVAFVAMRPCFLKADITPPEFEKWVENAPWVYVPTGAVIPQVEQGGPNPPTFAEGASISTVRFPSPNPWSSSAAVQVRAVIFRPTGRLLSPQRQATIVEGAVPPGGTGIVVKQASNWFSVQVNQFTGRVSFRRPEDP